MVQQVCKYAHGKYSKYASMHMASTASMPSIACGKPGKYGMVWYGMATPAPAKERSIKEYSICRPIQKPPYTPHINMLYTVKILQDPVQYQLHKTYQSMHNTWPECNQSLRKENTLQEEYTLCTGELAITASKESDQPVNIDPFTEDQRFLQLAKWYNRPTLNISQAFQWYFICFVWRPSSNDL